MKMIYPICGMVIGVIMSLLLTNLIPITNDWLCLLNGFVWGAGCTHFGIKLGVKANAQAMASPPLTPQDTDHE